MSIRNYRDLVVWRKAMDLVDAVYRLTRGFPKEELYGLTSQVRRAAVSIPSNIAEGHGRRTCRHFLHFLSIARGSIKELETQLLIAGRLGYANQAENSTVLDLSDEVSRLTTRLMDSLRRKNS
jgi:four helix bundle protein